MEDCRHLTAKPARVAASKHLIAFANRDFAQAARNAEGYAYLILGVEPGNLCGVPVWDSADIENWLSPYTGADLRYGPPDYITVDGAHVLVLVVDPPNLGDPIYCMQKAGGDANENNHTVAEGTIYVRRGGKSERHTGADLRRLTARATTTVADALRLSVELDETRIEAINAGLLQGATCESYVEAERKRLLSSLPRRSNSPFEITMPSFDNRSQDEFLQEVRVYLDEVESRRYDVVAAHHVEEKEPFVVATIHNETPSNFEDVVLELNFPLASDRVFASLGEVNTRLASPEPPRVWGTMRSLVMPEIAPVRLPLVHRPELEAIDEHHVLVRYPAIHARPRSRHRLDRLLLALPPDLAGTTMDVDWRATSRSTDGDLSGTAALAIPQS